MPGVTGREANAAFARSNTWGTPASVTRQIPIKSAEGLDSKVNLVDDEAFNQDYLTDAEVGDHSPTAPSLGGQLRYEGWTDWLAAPIGSPATTSVSSQGAATSLVAHQHVVVLSPENWPFFTLAVDNSQYVTEVPTLKIRGFMIRVGANGVMEVEFQTVGNKSNLGTSTVNINSTVAGAVVNSLGNRVFRKQGTFRMNVQGAGALAAANANSLVKEISFGITRPLADDDHVLGNDSIAEPDDNGFAEFPLELTFARMNTVSANSLARALGSGTSFKADLDFLGNFINSTTQREMKFEWPNLQLYTFEAQPAGHGQVKPKATFKGKLAASSPAGMAFVNPFRMVLTNLDSTALA